MWTVAPKTVKWTAQLVDNSQMPQKWGEFKAEGEVLRLKDTRHKHWKNRLVAPNKFVYQFPKRPNPKYSWESPLVSAIQRRVSTKVPLLVELFSTPGSRNEFYGQWVVEEMRIETGESHVSELQLARLHNQSASVGATGYGSESAPRFRSRNEELHGDMLEEIFPPDKWIVKHEPETLLDLHEPSVVDGVPVDVTDMSRSYTCDFVVASRDGCHRFCVESKPIEEHVTDEARAKCRVLRDTTLTRVIFMVGTTTVRYLDLGAPGAAVENWFEDAESLRAALRV